MQHPSLDIESNAGSTVAATLLVTGHGGLVGSALHRAIEEQGTSEPLIADRHQVDLCNWQQTLSWFESHRPHQVIHAAGRVGGIAANHSQPVQFLRENALMFLTVLEAAHRTHVEKLLYLGSSCVYPRACPQPIKEEFLLSGPLEPTNEAYAIAKIGGLLACRAYRRQYGHNYIAAMPTNLYGPNDNFDLENAHVLPALMRKFHEAKLRGDKQVTVWGSGRPRREFLHVDDLAEACLFLMEHYDDSSLINIGTGHDIRIAELADIMRAVVYPEAAVVFDRSRPDGTPRKCLDVSRIQSLGWQPKISLEEGVRRTYEWFVNNLDNHRVRM